MSTVAKPLRYLFNVQYMDGSIFLQPENDRAQFAAVCNGCGIHFQNICGQCPGCESDDLHFKSAFADVDIDKVAIFGLSGEGQYFSVNLTNGMFHINGVDFQAHPQNYIIAERLKLIFFREVQRTQVVQATVQEDLSVSMDPVSEDVAVKKYFIGWETSGPGKQKCIIGIE